MQLAWPLRCGGPTLKAVLIALADHANERGECYPSIPRIASRTELSERAVRGALRALEVAGLIRSTARSGTSSIYTLTLPTPAAGSGPAVDAEGQEVPHSPEGSSAPPRHDVPPTPAAGAPKPSMNHHLNHQGTHSKGADKLPRALGVRELVAEGVDRQHAEDWLKVRSAKRAPLTSTAWDDVKAEAVKAGITPADAVKVSATNSWQGFKATWYARLGQEGAAPAARGPAATGTHGGYETRNYGTGGLL